jgi:hypothetical protein
LNDQGAGEHLPPIDWAAQPELIEAVRVSRAAFAELTLKVAVGLVVVKRPQSGTAVISTWRGVLHLLTGSYLCLGLHGRWLLSVGSVLHIVMVLATPLHEAMWVPGAAIAECPLLVAVLRVAQQVIECVVAAHPDFDLGLHLHQFLSFRGADN